MRPLPFQEAPFHPAGNCFFREANAQLLQGVYVQAVGGAGALYAASVKRVAGVDLFEEFGAAEACWHFEVEGFRGVVAMDAHGNSLFDKVASASDARLREIL